MQARYVQRSASVDFQPARSVAAGEIVVLNDLVGVAKLPISNGELGSLTLTGIFDVVKTERCAFSAGSRVFWDAARQSAVTSGDVLLGLAARPAKIDAQTVRVILNSGGITAGTSVIPEGNLVWQTIN